MTAFDFNAVVEDEMDRFFQYRKGGGAEEQHENDTDPADGLAVLKKAGSMVEQRVGDSGNQQLQVALNYAQELFLLHYMGEADQNYRDKRKDGEQEVESDGTRKDEALIRSKIHNHAP